MAYVQIIVITEKNLQRVQVVCCIVWCPDTCHVVRWVHLLCCCPSFLFLAVPPPGDGVLFVIGLFDGHGLQ